jgi:excisionase family DNA binding protein
VADQAVKRVERDESGSGQKRDYFWRTTEVARLERLSAEEAGVEQLMKELPGRTLDAIKKKAGEMNLPLPAAKAVQVWKSDGATDELIRQAYGEGSRGSVTELAMRLGVERWRISKRAGELGVASVRLKETEWGARELRVLEDFGENGAAIVHRELRKLGYERSVGTVATMLTQWQSKRERCDCWSARTVAELMGVDPHTVLRWITQGGLKAKQEGGQWEISRKSLKQWVLSHAHSVDLKRVDKYWFIDMLGGS